METRLVAVQLETCHANTDGSAWYAYFDGQPTNEDIALARTDTSVRDKCCLGLEGEDETEEVPNHLSNYTGLRRFYVGTAG